MLINPLLIGASIFGLNSIQTYDVHSSCPIGLPETCTNSTPIENSCCFESPSGTFLLTQFWDYYPPIGDNDTFTLHGIWPNLCYNKYLQFCDHSLEISKVRDIVSKFDPELVKDLDKYWKNINGNDESLWEHEFNKHGTCVNTIKPTCYVDYEPYKNVYDYFKVAMNLYKTLPTFKYLEAEGIVPSEDKTYTKKEINAALVKHFGHEVQFKCNRYNGIQEIWYYHHLKGPLTSENFVPIEAVVKSDCPETGIKFFPKGSLGHQPPPKDPSNLPRGFLKIKDGCAISNGRYFTKGTCATFKLKKAPFGGYNLLSSKGTCFVDNGKLFCNRQKIGKDQFNYKDGKIGYSNTFKWCVEGDKDQKDIVLSDGTCEGFDLTFEKIN